MHRPVHLAREIGMFFRLVLRRMKEPSQLQARYIHASRISTLCTTPDAQHLEHVVTAEAVAGMRCIPMIPIFSPILGRGEVQR